MNPLRPLQFRSFADLAADVARGLHRVPADVELVVGVPRSGVLAASVVALSLNLRTCDLPSLLRDEPLRSGQTRRASGRVFSRPQEARSVLVLDDSIASGGSMERVRAELAASGFQGRVRFGAVYATTESARRVDVHFGVVETPRLFQWNLFHRAELADCCVDIDGVLCLDPTPAENDDGPRYRAFLADAVPLARPSYPIGHIVTSRLERYRPETEAWLRAHGVQWGALHMLDLPDAAARRRTGAHGAFKAQVYQSLPTTGLFVESEPAQAAQIARLSGKPVLDYSTQTLVRPTPGLAYTTSAVRSLLARARRRLAA